MDLWKQLAQWLAHSRYLNVWSCQKAVTKQGRMWLRNKKQERDKDKTMIPQSTLVGACLQEPPTDPHPPNKTAGMKVHMLLLRLGLKSCLFCIRLALSWTRCSGGGQLPCMKAPRQPVNRSAWWGTKASAKNHLSEFGKWFSSLKMTADSWDTLSQDHPDSWPTELWMGQCPVRKRGEQEWEAAKYSTSWAHLEFNAYQPSEGSELLCKW